MGMMLKGSMDDLAAPLDAAVNQVSDITVPSAPGYTYRPIGVLFEEVNAEGRETGQMAIRVKGAWA
jgi:hypothetical protein